MKIKLRNITTKNSTFNNAKKIFVTNAKCVQKLIHFYQGACTGNQIFVIVNYFADKD